MACLEAGLREAAQLQRRGSRGAIALDVPLDRRSGCDATGSGCMAGLLARTALPSSSRIDLVTRRCRQSGTDKRKTATDYTGQRRAIGYCDQTTAAYRRGGEREERLNPVRLPVRWRLSCQLLGRQCRPKTGQKSPPTASPTSTTTSTAHRKRSEALPHGSSTDAGWTPPYSPRIHSSVRRMPSS